MEKFKVVHVIASEAKQSPLPQTQAILWGEVLPQMEGDCGSGERCSVA
jgi:hypothetical protein